MRQQALVHRRPQDRTQRLLDSTQRRRTDRTLPLHRLDLPRITAGPVFGDQLVALHDRLDRRPLYAPTRMAQAVVVGARDRCRQLLESPVPAATSSEITS
ncbi:hypothetical protein [Amycolatopsis balhimycina]|uniref:hypothetical protein n=1 Tax=Amycolatopsis balhimycina TaxID=208443 RepID=UPI000F76C3B0|nr:hypothetical protein [Amycolatopsis balhimycina]